MNDESGRSDKPISAAEAAEYGGFQVSEEPLPSPGQLVSTHFELDREINDELEAACAKLSRSEVEHALRRFLIELRRSHNGGRPFAERRPRAGDDDHTPDGWYD